MSKTLAVAVIALVTACSGLASRPSAADLIATLPTTAGGAVFDHALVVDDNLLSGFVVDDVLSALGKRRSDATAVFRLSSVKDAAIGAVAVSNVNGDALLNAFPGNWQAPATVRVSQRAVKDTRGWETELRDGQLNVFYPRGDVVYIVWSDQRQVLEAVLADMP